MKKPSKAALAVGAFVLLASVPARAEIPSYTGSYISIGPLLTFLPGGPSDVGVGGEVSLTSFSDRTTPYAVGLFSQVQAYGDKPDWHTRWAAGALASVWFLGAELGLGRRAAVGPIEGTWEAHVAAYLTIGYVAISLRGELPVTTSERLRHEAVAGLSFHLKLPLRIGKSLDQD